MARIKQIHLCFVIIFLTEVLHESTCEIEKPKKETEEALDEAETNGKLEIIKRIKKINEDGSYTIGYEADDGSFKIESRDVLGHIKGTYGFVDDEGQIKRVSYSTTNASDIISKPEPTTVVQRIPTTRTSTSPYIFTSTQSTPTTTTNSVIQSIAKRRTTASPTSTSSTTDKPNYQHVVNVSQVTQPKSIVYSSAAPRVLLQGRSSLSTTPATLRAGPERVVSVKPSEESFYSSLVNQDDVKPVSEEPRGNLLRRQLPQREKQDYNVREHIFSLQQSLGHDATDVYSNSMTTGTPRPLFTTTNRPIPIQVSSTAVPPRPTSPHLQNYHNNYLQGEQIQESPNVQRPSSSNPADNNNNYLRGEQTQVQYNQEYPTPVYSSPTTVHPNRAEPLVAIRQSNQQTVLVPLSHFQGRIVPYEHFNEPRGYHQYVPDDAKQMVVEIEQQQAVVKRLPQHPLRPMPVQVDERGYIRELPRHVPTPYPVPIPATPVPRYLENDIDNDIENIQPPVSTKDFQKLLHMLIQRQSRLEKISALTSQPEIYMQPKIYQQEPYFVQKVRSDLPHQRQNFVEVQQQHLVPLRNHPQQQLYEEQYASQSGRPNRRVARLLPPRDQEVQEEYLPSDVREMLLLRMLQLAINPAMPVPEDDIEVVNRSPLMKRTPVRNVEILGEEGGNEDSNRSGRTKRFEQSQDSYFFKQMF